MSDHVDMDGSTRPAKHRVTATSRTHVVVTASYPLTGVGGHLLDGRLTRVLVRARERGSESRDGLGRTADRD
jgi:hypothetical protein